MSVELLSPAVPGRYQVGFSMRTGGVSEGAYASLNIGLLTDDEPAAVQENRARIATAAGVAPDALALAWQQHGADVVEAGAAAAVEGGAPPRCDGLWSDVPGRAMVLVTADCLPVAVWRTEGPPVLAVLHAGWRGLLAGILEEGCRAIGPGSLAAAVGPGIGPCCYEVGEEVAGGFRARFGAGVLDGRRLSLRRAAEVALLEAGCGTVEQIERCTACEEAAFFSHRRDGGVTGRQGVIAHVRGE